MTFLDVRPNLNFLSLQTKLGVRSSRLAFGTVFTRPISLITVARDHNNATSWSVFCISLQSKQCFKILKPINALLHKSCLSKQLLLIRHISCKKHGFKVYAKNKWTHAFTLDTNNKCLNDGK